MAGFHGIWEMVEERVVWSRCYGLDFHGVGRQCFMLILLHLYAVWDDHHSWGASTEQAASEENI